MPYRTFTRDEHFQQPGPKRILALDGGGLRGIVALCYLERIEAYDETTVNAITVLNPRALSRADELDGALADGEELGSLFCVPMLAEARPRVPSGAAATPR